MLLFTLGRPGCCERRCLVCAANVLEPFKMVKWVRLSALKPR